MIILGGPHDGLSVDIPGIVGEGQKFLVENVEYFVHRHKNGLVRLIYYSSSKEA
ncbi:hypothetical protein PBI_COUNT_92 [Microbacterium phage Count]|nr:hypothetical protein PBI_COUNT_92 [Microbacterium phage Count]